MLDQPINIVRYSPQAVEQKERERDMRAARIETYNYCNLQAGGLRGSERVAEWDKALAWMKARAENYMPRNYRVVEHQHSLYMVGSDVAGWTLDGYVLPRLASGSIFATEVDDSSTLCALECKNLPKLG